LLLSALGQLLGALSRSPPSLPTLVKVVPTFEWAYSILESYAFIWLARELYFVGGHKLVVILHYLKLFFFHVIILLWKYSLKKQNGNKRVAKEHYLSWPICYKQNKYPSQLNVELCHYTPQSLKQTSESWR